MTLKSNRVVSVAKRSRRFNVVVQGSDSRLSLHAHPRARDYVCDYIHTYHRGNTRRFFSLYIFYYEFSLHALGCASTCFYRSKRLSREICFRKLLLTWHEWSRFQQEIAFYREISGAKRVAVENDVPGFASPCASSSHRMENNARAWKRAAAGIGLKWTE